MFVLLSVDGLIVRFWIAYDRDPKISVACVQKAILVYLRHVFSLHEHLIRSRQRSRVLIAYLVTVQTSRQSSIQSIPVKIVKSVVVWFRHRGKRAFWYVYIALRLDLLALVTVFSNFLSLENFTNFLQLGKSFFLIQNELGLIFVILLFES